MMLRCVVLACLLVATFCSAKAQVMPPVAEPGSGRVFCEQSVNYRIADPATVPEAYRRFLGVWSDAAWSADSCAALIVDNVDPDGTASIIYVYGPPGSNARAPAGCCTAPGSSAKAS